MQIPLLCTPALRPEDLVDQPSRSCAACGHQADPQLEIPVTHGVSATMVVPPDWCWTWEPVPACRQCYELQGDLVEPVALGALR